MCHKDRGPRCTTCHKPAPRHRCRCPAKYASAPTTTPQHDGLPTYAAVIDPDLAASTLLPISVQSRCGGCGNEGCGYRKRQCRGPISLLVGLEMRKVQEKKEREVIAANLSDDRVVEVQERGVVETVDEKEMEDREVRGEEKDEDVKVFTESVRSLSL